MQPENDGLIGVVDPGSPVVTDFTVFLADQLGEEGMAQLRDLNPVFYDTAVPAQQGLAAGEVAITLYATAQLQRRRRRRRAGRVRRSDAGVVAAGRVVHPRAGRSTPTRRSSCSTTWRRRSGQEAIAINGASALDGIPGTLADIDDVQPVDIDRRHRRMGGAVPGRVGGVLRSVTGR